MEPVAVVAVVGAVAVAVDVAVAMAESLHPSASCKFRNQEQFFTWI
jgi:hypothetical protein